MLVKHTPQVGLTPLASISQLETLIYVIESIADYTRRPLFTLGFNDLSATSARFELALADAMSVATRWNAIVLIDEADVFMEQRGRNGVFRDELVSSNQTP